MNRRSIFKLLAGAACAAAMEITGLVPSLPKAAKYVVNPEWLSATYEDVVIFSRGLTTIPRPNKDEKEVLGRVIKIKRNEQDEPAGLILSRTHSEVLPEASPNRYNFANGEYQHIPAYILES